MMMLFSMAFRNIKKRFRDYAAFFLSSSFSIFVLYLFLSVYYNQKVLTQLDDSKSIMVVFGAGAYLVAFFVAFFMWYSNSYFIKAHKKEFATYMLLGVSKRQTAFLNFIENSIILIMAFFTGIAAGILLNKFFIMLMFVIVKSNVNVPFEFNVKAFKLTAVIFAVIYVLISIHGFRLINKNTLIELITASKKAERKLKVSLLTWIIGFAAIICIGTGYYLAVKELSKDYFLAPGVIILVSVGTILLFTGVISILIYINRKNEAKLYRGTKLITESQISYRYMSNVGTLSVIAISTSVALCAVITLCGLFGKVVDNSHNMRPFSVEYINSSKSADTIFESVLKDHNEVSIKSKNILNFVRVNDIDPIIKKSQQDLIMSESDFNKAMASQGKSFKVNLKNDSDCCYVTAMNSEGYVGKSVQIEVGKKNVPLNIIKNKVIYYIALDHQGYSYVVTDSMFDKIKQEEGQNNSYSMTCYQLKNDLTAKSFAHDLMKKAPKDANLLTFYEHYEEGMKFAGILMFIGVFIGLVFLTATGSIIYFRMFMESREDKDKYMILKRIGVSGKEIKGAISKELLVIFGAPFVVAVANASAALIPLEDMINLKIGNTFVIIIIVYAIFYSAYYFVTLHSYYKTVSE